MATTIPDRMDWLKNRFTVLPVVVRRAHRIVGILWILSFALTFVVDLSALPGPSIPGLSFIALIITGTYLLLRPLVRGPTTVSDRLKGLKHWTRRPSVVIRRTHRIVATLFLLFLVLALSLEAAGGLESQLVLGPIVVILLYLGITGLYMFLRPWVNRVRAR